MCGWTGASSNRGAWQVVRLSGFAAAAVLACHMVMAADMVWLGHALQACYVHSTCSASVCFMN
jgi:hypothetical protein